VILLNYEDKSVSNKSTRPVTTYHEEKHGNTLYRITNVYLGRMDFAKTIEGLIVRKVIMHESINLGNE